AAAAASRGRIAWLAAVTPSRVRITWLAAVTASRVRIAWLAGVATGAVGLALVLPVFFAAPPALPERSASAVSAARSPATRSASAPAAAQSAAVMPPPFTAEPASGRVPAPPPRHLVPPASGADALATGGGVTVIAGRGPQNSLNLYYARQGGPWRMQVIAGAG